MIRKCIGAGLMGGGLGIATALLATLASGCVGGQQWQQHTATGLKIAACVQGVLADEYATKEEQARELAKRETEAARMIEREAEAVSRLRDIREQTEEAAREHSPEMQLELDKAAQ